MAKIDILGVSHTYELTAPKTANPTLVFVHGWLLSRAYWRPLVEQLRSHYQCLAYDLRGFGESETIQGLQGNEGEPILGYTPSDYAKDLGLLLDRLQIEKAWLVGHSLGGSVSLWAASQLGDRIGGVFCLNSGGGIYLKEEFERFRSAGAQLVKRRPQWLVDVPLLDWLFTRSQVAQPLSRTWGRQRLIDFVTAQYEAALGALLDSTTEEEVHRLPQLVAQLQQPVYFIAGAEDKVMEPRYVRHLASFHELFRSGYDNVVELPGCGHFSMLEATDRVAEEIDRLIHAEEIGDRLAS
ncbi:alpha/beta hydrolase [Roseofilum sp. BLCC_M91]|uniref:Alpha/beta hydrolase n=1 Tax=Roseofilum halophilum BLCC-M91 TaxID=3022259 RepID=A0ABT7BM99_9CYAN|nr:alpha/beta hydrolase [Roseofilum halophilum]MDJ1179408.1 alpha/beta hydrolase [Roseofilum halophilum BLCC-M91]